MENKYYIKPEDLAVWFHPGETLAEKLEEMQMSAEDFALSAKLPISTVSAIICGRCSINVELATALESATQIPIHFWLNYQKNYDDYCQREQTKKLNSKSTQPRRKIVCNA